jgi:LysR family glycine cleavage system transcriptional activator
MRLNSLQALRAFAIAGREESIAKAAGELCLTPGAVSRQIAKLESELGARLFTRKGRRIALTPQGRSFHAVVCDSLERIHASADVLARKRGARGVLTLTTLPSFAARWLGPRLPDFFRRHPAVALNISTGRGIADIAAREFDAALRYGKGPWPGVHAELILRETLTPVCSPAWLRAHRRLKLHDLARLTLLHSDNIDGWSQWLRAAGVKAPAPIAGPHFQDDGALLEATIAGAGLALGRSALIEADLKAERLVAPFALRARASYAYWLVTPAGREHPATPLLRSWLLEQARASR